MTLRTVLAIVLAITCGMSAAVGVNQLRATPSVVVERDTSPVVVAAVNIPRGVLVTEELLAVRDWPKEMVPPGAIATLEEAKQRAALTPLYKDEPLLSAKLAARNLKSGLAALIPPGMRACSILSDSSATGVAGFILPGTRVDVLLTVTGASADKTTGGGSTATLLQNVEVLAVNQELDAPSENKMDVESLRSVTLLVTPDQAAKLSLAQEVGVLHLTLRSYGDPDPADTEPVTMKQIQFLEEPPLPPTTVAAAERPVIEPSLLAPVPSEPEPIAPVRIWTMRGNSSSVVHVHPGQEISRSLPRN